MISPRSTRQSDADFKRCYFSRFGSIFMMKCNGIKRWWYLIGYEKGYLVLCAGLAVCAWTDFKFGKVQNGCLLFLAFAGALHKGVDFFAPALIFLTVGMCLFRFRVMGAGDGKLMAVIGGYLGLTDGFYAIALGFFTGAVWSLWKMKRYGIAMERFHYLQEYAKTTIQTGVIRPYDSLQQPKAWHHLPFAVCLAAGVMGYLLLASHSKIF